MQLQYSGTLRSKVQKQIALKLKEYGAAPKIYFENDIKELPGKFDKEIAAWKSYRDLACEVRTSPYIGGTGYSEVYQLCYGRVTKDFVEILFDTYNQLN